MSDSSLTRPALRTRREAERRRHLSLRVTTVFHPHFERIGAFVDLAVWPMPRGRQLGLGRLQPLFSDDKPIAEPHVSRAALNLQSIMVSGSVGLQISAAEYSDVRIGAEERESMVADEQALERGVPIRLGHGVVVLLRVVDLSGLNPLPQPLLAPLLGASVELLRVSATLARAANTLLPVLLLGESGVGKEVAAQAVHRASRRSEAPLISVNMAAVSESLAPAQLFGSNRGAFTGAEKRAGYFREADGGTLFLDEIGDTPESVQTQLLRALEQGEVQTVGGETSRVDVRVIAATDASVAGNDGFRHALFTRLSGAVVTIPPLRQRREDIGAQGLFFLLNAAPSHPTYPVEMSADEPSVAAYWARIFFDALSLDWPGNSRDLRHHMILAAAGTDDSAEYAIAESAETFRVTEAAAPSDADIYAAYEQCEFEVAATADALGMSRPALYRRIALHPDCWLESDLSDAHIVAELNRGGDVAEVAKRLRVSRRSLQARLRRLDVS